MTLHSYRVRSPLLSTLGQRGVPGVWPALCGSRAHEACRAGYMLYWIHVLREGSCQGLVAQQVGMSKGDEAQALQLGCGYAQRLTGKCCGGLHREENSMLRALDAQFVMRWHERHACRVRDTVPSGLLVDGARFHDPRRHRCRVGGLHRQLGNKRHRGSHSLWQMRGVPISARGRPRGRQGWQRKGANGRPPARPRRQTS